MSQKYNLTEHPSVILIASRSEARLLRIQQHLKEENIGFSEFREPDIGHQLTSIATEPILDQATRDKLGKYQLYS